ncbi:MAG: YbaN family protein [Gordonia sp. (in: high G+C Gram-positive bacteria)]|uniref:YbaN family protein n=1 Tax=Gordonia sp. (in: high G+C Gram-positive bacteria) TaxID=84139 RepID=UPI0039E4F0D6
MAEPGRARWAWWALAYLSLGLGFAGVVLPVLPTVPFILLAAYAAARGSDRLHRWLLDHPRFGPMITDWQEHGAVSRRSKWLATISMLVCGVVLLLVAPIRPVAYVSIGIMAVVGTWLWLRPEAKTGLDDAG